MKAGKKAKIQEKRKNQEMAKSKAKIAYRRTEMINTDGKRCRQKRRRKEAAYEAEITERSDRKRRGRKKKLPGWVILPIIAGIVLICFCITKVTGGNTKGVRLNVVEARREDIREVYNTSGTVVSGKSKIFYSPVNAPVKKNRAKVGESVKKGDKLIIFDTANLDRDNKNSRLNTLSAQYTNQDAKEQSGRTKESMARAKKQENAMISELKSQIKKKRSEIQKLEKQVKKSAGNSAKAAEEIAGIQKKMADNLDSQSIFKAKKENAERKLSNLNNLEQDSELAKTELAEEAEEATDEISRLEREYRAYEQELKKLGGEGSGGDISESQAAVQSLAQAKQELETLSSSLTQAENSRQTGAEAGLTSAQLGSMKVSEDIARLAELTAKELLEKGREGIKAEFDGIIADVKVAEGSDAVQGGELFTLVSNRKVSVEVEAAAGDFEYLETGEKAVITIGRHTYKGTLESVNKIALPNEKGNPVIGAKLRIDNPDDGICIGVSAKVNITVAEKKDALCLPNEVINTAADGDFVYVIKNGTLLKQKVETGVASASMSEIVSGIKEGDQVVSDMSATLKEGMKATAVKAGDTADKGDKRADGE